MTLEMNEEATSNSYPAVHYKHNINLEIDPWLHYFIIGASIINLILAAFTLAFQMTHPKSR